MARKFNNRILLLILAVLAIILAIGWIFDPRKEDRSFRAELVTADTARIAKVTLHPKSEEHQTITLTRENNFWMVQMGDIKAKADQNSVKNAVLNALVSIKPMRLVARTEDRWPTYEVNEALGTRVQVQTDRKQVADFIVGKFNFQQEPQRMSTYVRLTEEADVYEVEGMLSFSFNQKFSNWRDKTLVRLNPEALTSISLQSGETFRKEGTTWFLQDQAVDSLEMATYLGNLRSLNGSTFNDTFAKTDQTPLNVITYKGISQTPQSVYCYPNTGEQAFTLHSTMAPENYFSTDSSGIYDLVFGKLEALSRSK